MVNILYIGNKLSKHGISATTIETLGKSLENEGFKVFYASEKKNKAFRLMEMLWKTIYFRKIVDYIIIDTYSTSNFWYAFLVSQLARWFKIKYIPILHGGNLPLRLKNNPKLSKLIFNNAHVNVAPSNYLYSAFKEFRFTNLVHIPNSIELENYIFLEKEYSCPKILWVRSLDSIYNPEMAIKVFAKIKEKHLEARLCMVGGEKNTTIQSLEKVAKNFNVSVSFTGKLLKSDWIALSENYNFFINTTHVDNTPVSVIEAMALGFPIVSTNVGGLPYLINNYETGLLVDDNDEIAMANAINLILKDEILRNKIISNGRLKAKSFDWEVVKYDWFKILK